MDPLTFEAVSDQSPPPMGELKKKALQASVWSILEYGSGMALRIVSSLVLTRLLLPAYFGELTLVTTLTVGISLLSDIGLAPSVIQSTRGDDPIFLNTAWTIQVVRGTALWLIAVALSWPMAIFYHDPRLKILLPVLAFCSFISSFNSTNLLTLSRHMGVKRLFAIDGTSAVLSLLVTVVWAYLWPSVWAIIGGQLVSTVYRLCISFIPSVAPGIRNSFHWDKESVHQIVHFGRWILLATAFTFFATQADRLVLGRLNHPISPRRLWACLSDLRRSPRHHPRIGPEGGLSLNREDHPSTHRPVQGEFFALSVLCAAHRRTIAQHHGQLGRPIDLAPLRSSLS